MIRPLAIALALVAGPAAALELELPAPARIAAEDTRTGDSVILPQGPWDEARSPAVTAAGRVERRVWWLPGTSRTTLQIMDPLAAQIAASGYRVRYECADRACGGFDFRHALDLLPAPEMHVDLGDFRYLFADRDGPDGPERLSLVVSRGGTQGYVHLTRVTPASAPPDPPPPARETARPADATAPDAPDPDVTDEATDEIVAALDRDGHVPLDDLRFATGATRLEDREFASLAALAGWLAATPDARLVLVGHSDAVGALAANTALSRRRAEAVRTRLIDRHGADPGRIAARGAGFLAPRASNATEAGRARNRRVEAVRTDTAQPE